MTSIFQGHKLWLEEASHLLQSTPVPYSMLPPSNAQGAKGTQRWLGSCHVHSVSQPHASNLTGYVPRAPPLVPLAYRGFLSPSPSLCVGISHQTDLGSPVTLSGSCV